MRPRSPTRPTPRKRSAAARPSPRLKRRSRRLRRRPQPPPFAGGEAFAHGANGCVFRPALRCPGQKQSPEGKISKLSLTNVSQREWAKVRVIRTAIDDASKAFGQDLNPYFILPDTEPCVPQFKQEDLGDEFRQHCNNYRGNNVRILQITDGGATLYDRRESTTLRLIPKLKFIPFLNAMIQLLQNGIVPLNRQGVLHGDIKPDNVVCETKNHKYEIRLIDWDRFVTRETVYTVMTQGDRFQTKMNQPVAYAFCSQQVPELVGKQLDAQTLNKQQVPVRKWLDAETLITELPKLQNNHPVEQQDAAEYATGSREMAENNAAQIQAIVHKFYRNRTVTKQFDWTGYVELLIQNYDVYGWLSVINFCMQKQGTMFSDAARYDYYVQPMKAFLRHYMYTPTVLVEPYDTAAMIKLLNEIRQSPLYPTALPEC